MKQLLLTLLFFLPFLGSLLHTQTVFQIDNPAWWGLDNVEAKIDFAEIRLRPVGIFTEVELTLSLYSDSEYYTPGTWLEAILDFSLPVNSIVHDSYLLIEDSLCRADILDRWSAEATYEEIVGRQRDPSILTKEGDGQYTLRVYPVPAGTPRLVRMHYLLPVTFWESRTLTELPIDLLRSAGDPYFPVDITVELPPGYYPPRLGLDADNVFLEREQLNGYQTYHYNALSTQLDYTDQLLLQPVESSSVQLSVSPEESLFQLAYAPTTRADFDAPVDLVLAINYSRHQSVNLDQAQLLDLLEGQLKLHLRPTDRFNVSYGYGKQLSADWISADAAGIEAAMNQLRQADLHTNEGDPLNTLTTAINIAQLQSERGQIILLNNSPAYSQTWQQGRFLTTLNSLLGNQVVPIHSWDFQDRNLRYDPFQTGLDRQHFAIYRNLSVTTDGFFEENGTLSSRLSRLLQHINRSGTDLELFVEPENGFGLQHFRINNPGIYASASQPLSIIGQYTGQASGGFKVHALYLGSDSVSTQSYTIDAATITQADTLIREMWYGQLIRTAEGSVGSGWSIADILRLSKQERVLSRYTAFLCLEPGLEPCTGECGDEGFVVSAESKQAETFELIISPNPFKDRLRLEINWLEIPPQATIQLIGIKGDVLKQFSLQPELGGTNVIEWTSETGLPTESGLYWLVLETEKERRAFPVVLQ